MAFRHWVLGFSIVGAAHSALPSTAFACSCLRGIYTTWPTADAEGVPTNTSVILNGGDWLPFAAEDSTGSEPPPPEPAPSGVDAGTSSAVMSAPDAATGAGHSVEYLMLYAADYDEWLNLVPRRRLTHSGGCTPEFTIALPEQTLRPGTRYELHAPASLMNVGPEQGTTLVMAFQTGPGEEELTPKDLPKVSVLGDEAKPESILALYVAEFPDVPLLMHTQGTSDPVTAFLNSQARQAATIDLGGVECPEVEFVDILGNSVASDSYCGADKCYSFEVASLSSCGGNPSVGVSREQFDSLPDGCSGGGVSQDTAQTGTDDGSGSDIVTADTSGDDGNPVAAETEPDVAASEDGGTRMIDNGDQLHAKHGIDESSDSRGCAVGSTGRGRDAGFGAALLALMTLLSVGRREPRRHSRSRKVA